MKNIRIIKRNFEFQEIISKQSVVKNRSYIIYLRKKDTNLLRYGVSVGKKLGNAVHRNKIKRQIRLMINGIIEKYKDKNWDMVVIARNTYRDNSFETNMIQLDKLLSIIK